MKVHDLKDEEGRLLAFEVDNSLISRHTVIEVLKSVPGLVVLRGSLPWYRLGICCEFEIGGSTFKVFEPSDERSRLWIGLPSGGYSPQTDVVKSAFLRHSPPRWVVPIRILAIVLLGFGGIALGIILLKGPSLASIDVLTFLSGGLMLVGAVLIAWNVFRERNAVYR